ncbi:MAG: sulfite exporter TauE/SafE family protein [Acidobacteriota bacterium]
MWFLIFIFLAATIAGSIAAVTGFGIGSVLTPTLGLIVDTKTAVAAVSIPHLVGTAVRFWNLRPDVDRRTLWRFGVPSAAGGLTGALLHERVTSPLLTTVFGALLIFVAASELTGLARRMRFKGALAWTAGALSGLLGGLVGNQGGIRSAALLGFELPKRTFVATATAVGLIVDGARMPVYLVTEGDELRRLFLPIAVAIAGVIVGTVFGSRVLSRIPEHRFRLVVAVILAALGTTMLLRGYGFAR